MPASKRRRQIWRILRKIDFPADRDDCWLWLGHVNRGGYGVAAWQGRQHGAHRVVWWMFTGKPIPEGLELDHRCRTPACVNPTHLEPVTRAENISRSHRENPNRRNANSEKTHCPHGHSLTGAYVDPKGIRHCRECNRLACQARYRRLNPGSRLPHRERTHCPDGHPYDEANTYITPGGGRQCRLCKAGARRRYRERAVYG